MKCVKCGCEFEEGLFCPECGAKYDEKEAEEKRIQDEIRMKEEKEKRKLELEKAKVEQEKLAVEKAAYEAELARQKNEKARIEQENRAKMEEQERKRQEELTRTFNGVLYNTIDEMNAAKEVYEEQERKRQEELTRTFNGVLYNTIEEMNVAKDAYEKQVAIEKQTKRTNLLAISSFVLALATLPLFATAVLWLPSIVLSIVFGVKAVKRKTNKKGLVIAGFLVDAFYILLFIVAFILVFNSI